MYHAQGTRGEGRLDLHQRREVGGLRKSSVADVSGLTAVSMENIVEWLMAMLSSLSFRFSRYGSRDGGLGTGRLLLKCSFTKMDAYIFLYACRILLILEVVYRLSSWYCPSNKPFFDTGRGAALVRCSCL